MNKKKEQLSTMEISQYDKMKSNYSENFVNEIMRLSNKEKRVLMNDLGLLIAYSKMKTTD